MCFFAIDDVSNFLSLIGSIKYQIKKIKQVRKSNNFKTQGFCQGIRHFERVYMGLKHPAIGILNEIIFLFQKIEFILKDPKSL